MQPDGNLVLYAVGSISVWNSGTAGHPEIWGVVMQSDGNLVMYNNDGGVMWARNTGTPGGKLQMQTDGNVVMYAEGGQVIWATNTVVPVRPNPPKMSDRLQPNEGLMPAKTYLPNTIVSANGGFGLVLQSDGNLVLLQASKALWSTNTGGINNIWEVVMQADGNLVMLDVNNNSVWQTGTASNPGAVVILQNDGNFVIYPPDSTKALWASGG